MALPHGLCARGSRDVCIEANSEDVGTSTTRSNIKFSMRTRNVMLVGLVFATGCSPGKLRITASPSTETVPTIVAISPTTATSAPSSATADRIALLAAAAQSRIGGITGTLTIVNRADGIAFTADEQAAIERALAPATITWAEQAPPVPPDLEHSQTNNWVLRLGSPVVSGDRATVESTRSCGSLCADGGASAFARQPDGSWMYEGPTGTQWMS
jgi:hypothetical protein